MAWIVAVNIALFVVVAVAEMAFGAVWPRQWLALRADARHTLAAPWTLLTYSLTHFSLLHLAFNMLWLVALVRLAEVSPLAPQVRAWKIYAAGAAAGAAAYVLTAQLNPSWSGGILAGASASVLALLGSMAHGAPGRVKLRLWLIGSVEGRWIALGALVLAMAGAGSAPAAASHAAGALTGWLMARRAAGASSAKARFRRTARSMRRYHNDRERLDQLLDRVRTSGFDSLSGSERRELQSISRRLNCP